MRPCPADRRLPYPSNLRESQWRRVAEVLPARHRARSRRYDLRNIVDAINYRWETGCAWRMLPHDFPPWVTVYSYYRRWRREGLLPRIRAALLLGPQSVPFPPGRGWTREKSRRLGPDWPANRP